MKIKGMLLASAAGVAVSPLAQAADLPTKVRAPVAAPVVVDSWAGFYIGGHVGGGAVRNSLFGDDYNTTTFIGGGQIGYNFQTGGLVWGIEADGSWLSGKKETHESGGTYGTHFPWLATVRGRLGVAFGNSMAYVTGGVAFTKIKASFVECSDCQGSYSKTKTGWVLGGGVEHMLTRNWTIGAELLLVDFGTNDLSGNGKTVRVSNSAIVGRLKVNYKF
jgi:outer membrane immunogenic protein